MGFEDPIHHDAFIFDSLNDQVSGHCVTEPRKYTKCCEVFNYCQTARYFTASHPADSSSQSDQTRTTGDSLQNGQRKPNGSDLCYASAVVHRQASWLGRDRRGVQNGTRPSAQIPASSERRRTGFTGYVGSRWDYSRLGASQRRSERIDYRTERPSGCGSRQATIYGWRIDIGQYSCTSNQCKPSNRRSMAHSSRTNEVSAKRALSRLEASLVNGPLRRPVLTKVGCRGPFSFMEGTSWMTNEWN